MIIGRFASEVSTRKFFSVVVFGPYKEAHKNRIQKVSRNTHSMWLACHKNPQGRLRQCVFFGSVG